MADEQHPQQEQQQQGQQQQDGGRRGEPNHQGGAAQGGHLNPQIDSEGDDPSDTGGQIAQDRQQSTGQGTGQS